MPAEHWVQLDLPATAEKEPAGQLAHVLTDVAPVAVEKVPALQGTQVAEEEAPRVVEYVPAGQAVHVLIDVAPVAVEKVPAGH